MKEKRCVKMYRKYLACTENDHKQIDWFTAGKLYPVYISRNNTPYIVDDLGDEWRIEVYNTFFAKCGTHFKEVFK